LNETQNKKNHQRVQNNTKLTGDNADTMICSEKYKKNKLPPSKKE